MFPASGCGPFPPSLLHPSITASASVTVNAARSVRNPYSSTASEAPPNPEEELRTPIVFLPPHLSGEGQSLAISQNYSHLASPGRLPFDSTWV